MTYPYYPIDLKALEKMAEQARVKNAEEIANNLKENYPNWTGKLPNCPCDKPEIDKLDSFKRSGYGLKDHHPGAASGYRSTKPVEINSSVNSDLPPLKAGQQCNYDQNENLITHGKGAGTADAASPSSSLINHYIIDVVPSKALSTEEYQRTWTPNNGNSCPANRGNEITKPETSKLDRQSNPDSKPEEDRSKTKDTPKPEEDRNKEVGKSQQSKPDSKPENAPQSESLPEGNNPSVNSENQQPVTKPDSEAAIEANTQDQETKLDSFGERSSVDYKSFAELESAALESFGEASSEPYQSFSEHDTASYESFGESNYEMAGERNSEFKAEMA